MKKRIFALLLVLVMVLSLAACGGGDDPDPVDDGADGEVAGESAPSAVLVVTGQLGDKSFNDSANRGMQDLKAMGWTTDVLEIGRDTTKWEPTLFELAESGKWDLIITNGSNAIETVQEVASEMEDQLFVVYDTEIDEGAYPNIYAMSYKQNEASYVAGVLAALVTTSDMEGANPEPVIGFIGGMEHPVISDFLVGYIEGAKSVEPDIKVIVSYVGSWDDTAKGKEVAIAQYNQGADIIFPAAEQAGLGCVEAAKDMGKYIIGVDSDQSMLFAGSDEDAANVILTSVLKNVDKSIVRAGELYAAGDMPFGTFETLGIPEDGAGIAYNEYYEANVPQEIRDAVEEARDEVVAGNVKVSTTVGSEQISKAEENAIIDSVRP